MVRESSYGSGDTTFLYVQKLTILLFSCIITPLLLLIDRGRFHYENILYWYFVVLRYYLAGIMLGYGFSKVFYSQFPFPSLSTLEETYGDSSPMRLLWTFMGYSPAFSVFTGSFEVIGAILLLYRSTVVLGALILVTVMSTVVMMNLCYDVPVKLNSMHYLFFNVLLLIPNSAVLYRFFFKKGEVSLKTIDFNLKSDSQKQVFRKIRITVKSIFILLLFQSAYTHYQGLSDRLDHSDTTPLYGSYRVETFVNHGDTLPPLTTDSIRWEKILLSRNYSDVYTMTKIRYRYLTEMDTLSKTIEFKSFKLDSIPATTLKYRDSAQFLYLSGRWRNSPISVRLIKKDMKSYQLINRGFHWINEFPNNH